MGQGTDGDRPIISSRAAKLAAGRQRSSRAKISGTKRRNHTSWPSANNKNLSHLINSLRDQWLGPGAVSLGGSGINRELRCPVIYDQNHWR
jgi:hypothetical protein